MRVRLAVLIGFLAVAGPVNAQTVTWQALPNSTLATVTPNPVPPGSNGIAGIVGAWNGAAFDTLRHQLLLVAGGGHADYGGNEVYAFQHATETWVLLKPPSTSVCVGGVFSPQCVWQPNPSQNVLPDGTPPAVHNYGSLGYDPTTDSVLLCGGARWFDGAPTNLCWRLHMNTLTWENLGVFANSGNPIFYAVPPTDFFVWDAAKQQFLFPLWVYYLYLDTAKQSSSIFGCSPSPIGGGGYNAALDPVGRKLYVIGQGIYNGGQPGQTRVLDLTLPPSPTAYCTTGAPMGTQDTKLPTSGAREVEDLYGSGGLDAFGSLGLVWDPVANVVVAYGETTDKSFGRVYTLSPSTGVWTAWDASGTPPPRPTTAGVWGKFWLYNDCLYVVTDTSKPVYKTCTLPWRGAPTYQVRVDTSGTGLGTVTGAGMYAAGAQVSLSAMAGTGSVFAGWSGDPLCLSGAFTMPARAVSCIATFNVTAAPTLVLVAVGSGSVFGAGTYQPGQVVTIAASPASSWLFSGWTGAGCPQAGSASVTMPATGTVTCTATFVQCSSGPLAATWTAVPRPIGKATIHPDPALSSTQGGQMKHARFAYNPASSEGVLTGGDHCGTGPGGFVGDCNFQPTVWSTRDLSSWTLRSPGCPASGAYPARPDNVAWAIDTTRHRGVIWPGFYGGLSIALSQCANPTPLTTAFLFDLAANTWGPVPWPPPNPTEPPDQQYWNDLGMTWSVYDPTSDSIYGYNWGPWGATFLTLNIPTGVWTRRYLGEQTPTQPYDDAMRNSHAERSQSVIDVQGRMMYFMPGFSNRMFRVRLDVPDHRGEWVSTAPPQCLGRDTDSMERYSVFDTDHRAVLLFCVPNLGGEVIGMAAYFVDKATWAWYPAPVTQPNAVIANAFVYSAACKCVLATGGHGIFTENPARPNPAPNPCDPDATPPCVIPPGNQYLPDPMVDWKITLS